MNLQIKAGMDPLYVCSGCDFTMVTDAGSRCWSCQRGRRPPSFDGLIAFFQERGDRRAKKRNNPNYNGEEHG